MGIPTILNNQWHLYKLVGAYLGDHSSSPVRKSFESPEGIGASFEAEKVQLLINYAHMLILNQRHKEQRASHRRFSD